jgi:hypothetical protein
VHTFNETLVQGTRLCTAQLLLDLSRAAWRIRKAFIFRSFILNHDDVEKNFSSRHVAHFDFYSSDAIAPFVREFQRRWDILLPECTEFVTKIFNALLPRFTNCNIDIRLLLGQTHAICPAAGIHAFKFIPRTSQCNGMQRPLGG